MRVGSFFWIAPAFAIAFVLDALAIPAVFTMYRPWFWLVLLLFWLLHMRAGVSIWLVVYLGLLADILQGFRLGLSALGAVLVWFFVMLFLPKVPRVTFWSACVLALSALLVFTLVLSIVLSFSYVSFFWILWWRSLSTFLVFVVLYRPLCALFTKKAPPSGSLSRYLI